MGIIYILAMDEEEINEKLSILADSIMMILGIMLFIFVLSFVK